MPTQIKISKDMILNFDLIWKLAFSTILVIIGLSIIFRDALGGKVNEEIKKIKRKKKLFWQLFYLL